MEYVTKVLYLQQNLDSSQTLNFFLHIPGFDFIL